MKGIYLMAVKVIGAGLAGCEAAWQLAKAGIDVELYEMKPKKFTPAHKYMGFAELVCSNSLKADRIDSAAGMLKEEMRRLGSVTMECAAETKVSAGGALAVDRKKFSDMVTAKIMESPHITVIEEEVTDIPDGDVIIATGPLTSDGLAESIGKICGDYLYFHDAAAPIVTYESLDKDKVFFASRYGKGEADYINCPMNKEEYLRFYNELINAESAPLHDFDKEHFSKDGFKVYEGCMPVEVLAKRGEATDLMPSFSFVQRTQREVCITLWAFRQTLNLVSRKEYFLLSQDLKMQNLYAMELCIETLSSIRLSS